MSDLKHYEQSNLDFHKVKPLDSNRLVTFVNHFIVSIAEQLNELSSCVDSRLHKLNNQINICHSNLVILEMKLNSISGLTSVPINENTTNHNNSESQSQQTQQMDNNSVDNRDQIQDNNTSTEAVIQTETETLNKVEDNEQLDEQKEVEEVVEEDPKMATYRKMLKLGISLGAVHQKMQSEGVDINLL